MSSALVRQALDFVDQDETSGKGGKRQKKTSKPRQGFPEADRDYRNLSRPRRPVKQKPAGSLMEENLKKLLALSRPTANSALTEKIMERAVKGKPLLEKIEVKTEEEKSILFPEEEPFKKFEKEYFCS